MTVETLGGTSWDPAQALRRVMRVFPTGVTIVTTGRDDDVQAMTANAVLSASLEPPLMLVSVHATSRMTHCVKASAGFVLNFLAGHQEHLARLFSTHDRPGGVPALAAMGGRCGHSGMPIVEGALAAIECELEAVHPAGDHELFLGRVVAMHLAETDGEALLFYRGHMAGAEPYVPSVNGARSS
ncbi:MAG TPA: flavin reductase family protein [Candidatus Dormibacteraeota bacterium]|nr:flavin reductase family protein [Candidatus Dormibacteraeota bacterium]